MVKDKILILGGGFISHALTKRLVENGLDVTVISRSTPEHLPEGTDWLQGDLSDRILIQKILPRCRTVVHLASTSTPNHHIHAPSSEAEENLLPLLRLLEILGDHSGIPLLYLSSGGAIYGNPTTLPVPEAHCLAPLSNHAASKAAAEHFLGVFAHQGNHVTILRPSNIYGPEQPMKSGFGVIRTLLEHIKHGTPMTIWGDGSIVRDYLYIDDMIDACIAVLSNPVNGTFNVGSGKGISINSLSRLVEQITGKTLDLRYQPARSVDVKEVVLNNTSIRNQYSWEPRYSIEQGIDVTWEWLKNTP